MGMTFFFLGTYHVVAARHEFSSALILFGCVDLAGATWTAIALRRDS